jgi:hypothetical protein
MTQPRRKGDARRTRRLIVRLTDEERIRLRAKAAEAGLGVSEYVRRAVIDGEVVVRRESGYGMAMAGQLRRGVNINQQIAVAHLNGEIPPELVRLWGKLEGLLDRIIKVE